MKRPEPDDVTDVMPKREDLRKTGAGLRETNADCALVVTPHPLMLAGQQSYSAAQAAMQPGETLASLLARHGVLPGEQWRVSLGGLDVLEEQWARVRPKHGHLVEARRVPQDTDTLRMAAFIALMVFAPAGMAAWQSALYYVGGSLLINKLLPPKAPDFANRQNAANFTSYSLSGGRNRARPFEPMSLVLGEPYCVPDLAANPYTYFASGEQYLWQLFHAGLNCASVNTLRIGQTALANYQNVSLSYEGFASGNTGLPLLSNVDAVAGALLDAPTSPGAWVTRTSSVNTIELAVDLEGTVFSLSQSSGAYAALTCVVEVEYRLVGAPGWDVFYISPPYTVTVNGHWEHEYVDGGSIDTWVPGYTYTVTPTQLEITNASTRPVRQTYRRQVAAGQYEVRARKVTANATASTQQNALQWSVLKSYQLDTGSYKGQARLGVQIQASGQLNGSLDEVNWQATAKPMPHWDGAAWVTATARANGLSNPGAQILLLARGIYDVDNRLLAGLGWADSQIDIESLKGFMVWCTAKGFTFDYHLQQQLALGDLLEAIAQAGMGTMSWHTGKLGVIWFADTDPVESVLNMGALKVKSFGVDYDTQTTADELELQYVDRARNNAWKSIRVTAPGVVTPQVTARQPLMGVTTEAHAAVLARFLMAQNIYQRKTVTGATDLEHLTFRRGTVMALSHDLTQWGYSGRVKAAVNAAGTVTLTLDDVVPAVGPSGQTSRYIGLRLAGEAQYRIFPIAAFSGSSRTLTLASAWPGGVPVPGDAADNPAWDALWIYDFKATPGQKLRVVSIEPQGNVGGARVALVPESAEFWTYVWTGAYTPPPNTSLLQGPPVVTSVMVTEQLFRQGNTYYTELTASLVISGSYDRAELWGAVDNGVKQLLDSTQGTTLNWRGGVAEVWRVEVRAFNGLLAALPYIVSYTVRGLAVRPPDITNFTIDGDRFKWSALDTVDLAGDQIRFHYGQNNWWPTATPLHDGLLLASPWTMTTRPAGLVTFMIKRFDTSGNESLNAAVITANLGDALISNSLFDWPQAPLFAGTITNGVVSAGVLQANATDFFYGPDAEPFYGPDTEPFFSASTYAELVYEFSITVTDDQAGTLVLQHVINASGYTIEYLRDSQDAFYGVDSDLFYGPDAEPFYGPPGQWATWPGSIDIVDLEIIRFRVTTAAGDTRGEIITLTPLIDVPDVSEQLNDIVIAPGGTRLPITKTYRVITNLSNIAVQDDGNGGVGIRIKDKNPTLGPLVAVVNGAGTEVAGLVDAIPQGY